MQAEKGMGDISGKWLFPLTLCARFFFHDQLIQVTEPTADYIILVVSPFTPQIIRDLPNLVTTAAVTEDSGYKYYNITTTAAQQYIYHLIS